MNRGSEEMLSPATGLGTDVKGLIERWSLLWRYFLFFGSGEFNPKANGLIVGKIV